MGDEGRWDAERTRYVLADAGWREMNRQVAALEADLAAVRRAAQAVIESDERSGGPWRDLIAALASSPGAAWLATVQEVVEAMSAASHALRSYQYGNGSPDLAESTADHVDALLARPEVQRWAGR